MIIGAEVESRRQCSWVLQETKSVFSVTIVLAIHFRFQRDDFIFQVTYGQGKINQFAPANGVIKPNTPHIRHLLTEAGSLPDDDDESFDSTASLDSAESGLSI
jgi:hypothetical protein